LPPCPPSSSSGIAVDRDLGGSAADHLRYLHRGRGHRDAARRRLRPRAQRDRLGLLTGLFIAAYTFNDGRTVKVLAVAPLLVEWLSNVIRAVIGLPLIVRRRDELVVTLRTGAWTIAGVASVRRWPTCSHCRP
jgi:hypothetical protein